MEGKQRRRSFYMTEITHHPFCYGLESEFAKMQTMAKVINNKMRHKHEYKVTDEKGELIHVKAADFLLPFNIYMHILKTHI